LLFVSFQFVVLRLGKSLMAHHPEPDEMVFYLGKSLMAWFLGPGQ
jgi:hypothetical protein